MNPTAVNLAKTVGTRPLRLRQASAQLLPPLPLYRRLLRVNRKLPDYQRMIGDSMVKSEFKQHRTADNPVHIIGFLSQWKLYLDELESKHRGDGEPFRGRALNEEHFDKMSDEQAEQLYDLMHATRDIWKTPDALESEASTAEASEVSTSTSSTPSPDLTPPSPPSQMSDPYPLPLSQPSLAQGSDQVKEDLDPLPQPLDRTGEDDDTMRARLVYQTRKRGTLETDLILSTFAKEYLGGMTGDEMREFDKLLDEPDWDIFYWAVEKREPPPKWKDTELLAKLKAHAKNTGRVVRVMPPLYEDVPKKVMQ